MPIKNSRSALGFCDGKQTNQKQKRKIVPKPHWMTIGTHSVAEKRRQSNRGIVPAHLNLDLLRMLAIPWCTIFALVFGRKYGTLLFYICLLCLYVKNIHKFPECLIGCTKTQEPQPWHTWVEKTVLFLCVLFMRDMNMELASAVWISARTPKMVITNRLIGSK